MAAKPVDPDLLLLADLADHAHKLINEFISLPWAERERATDLLAEIQLVIAEFRRLRPPLPLGSVRAARALRLVTTKPSCEICGKAVDLDSAEIMRAMRTVYHLACLEGCEQD